MSRILYDIWNEKIVITNKYIEYRDEIITQNAIKTFRVKDDRLIINSYLKEETISIMFNDSEDALTALSLIRDILVEKKNQEVNCFTRLFSRWFT